MNYCVRIFTAISQKTIELSPMFNLTLRRFGNKINVENNMKGKIYDSNNDDNDNDNDDDEYYNSMSIAHSLYDASNSDLYPLESYVTHMSHRNLQGAPTESSENSSNGRIPLRIRKDINPKMVISPIFKDCWDRKPKNESQINSESEYPNAIDIEEDEYFSKMSSEFAFKN